MGCCGEVECEILNDDFARTSLETLTFLSQSAHSSGYGYDVTMTSTPTSCSVGDTISGTSQLDYQEYSYYVKAVSSDTVSVEFLFVEDNSQALDPDPDTQGIETFTVKRLGSNYVGTDSSQPANYLWGVCSFGLVKSDETGEHGDVTWLEIVPLYQKPNVIISIEQKELNTHPSHTSKNTEIRTMAGDDALTSTYEQGVYGFNGFKVTEKAGAEYLETEFASRYYEYANVAHDPWGLSYLSAFDNNEKNTQRKADCVSDNVVRVQYCQKQFVRDKDGNYLPTEAMINTHRYVTMTLSIGERLNPSLITMMTGWDKDNVSTHRRGRGIGDKAYLFSTDRKQVLTKLNIHHNDRAVSACKGCFTDLELDCDKLKTKYAFADMESRGATTTFQDLGLELDDYSDYWSVSGNTIVFNQGDASYKDRLTSLNPTGFANGLLPMKTYGDREDWPYRQGFQARYWRGSKTPNFIGESYGLYAAVKVKLTAANSWVYHGYGIWVDSAGTGFINTAQHHTSDSLWVTDSRIELNKTYEMGVCVFPITGSDTHSSRTWSEYREVAWIKAEDGSFIV